MIKIEKYNKKVIFDYITGNEIEDFDIEDLEKDYKFMIEVIKYTNDKNLYNLCDDSVKLNYEFIKFMVEKFNSDIEFICSIVDFYLENENRNPIDEIELMIIMCNLIKNEEYKRKYMIYRDTVFMVKKTEIELSKIINQDNAEELEEIQLGFWFILDEFNNRDIILNFYAKEYINYIMAEINFENIIHSRFKSFAELEIVGINNFLIKFLSSYDMYLANYISSHLEVLNDLKQKLYKIKTNWNNFILLKESEMYNKIIDEVHNYIEEQAYVCPFDETEILYYIGVELGISKNILQYDSIDETIYEDIINNFTIDKTNMSMSEIRHYNNIKKLILNILKQSTLCNGENEVINNNAKQRNRILKIDFNNQK